MNAKRTKRLINNNSFVQNTVFDVVNPVTRRVFPNEITLEEQYSDLQEGSKINNDIRLCIRETRTIIGNPRSFWKKIFPNTAREIIFKSSDRCSFGVISYILHNYLGKEFTTEIVKQSLIRFYEEPFRQHKVRLLELFRRQWKPELWRLLNNDAINLPEAIMNETYQMTDIDIALLSKHFQLPIVLFSPLKLRNLFDDSDNIEWIILKNNSKDKFYFIRSHHAGSKKITASEKEPKSYGLIDTPYLLSELRTFNEEVNAVLMNKTKHITSFDILSGAQQT